MLNENQYIRLQPHIAVIKQTVITRATITTAPFYVMNDISMEFGRPPANGYCGACVLELYDYIGALIKKYEATL